MFEYHCDVAREHFADEHRSGEKSRRSEEGKSDNRISRDERDQLEAGSPDHSDGEAAVRGDPASRRYRISPSRLSDGSMAPACLDSVPGGAESRGASRDEPTRSSLTRLHRASSAVPHKSLSPCSPTFKRTRAQVIHSDQSVTSTHERMYSAESQEYHGPI